MPKITKSTITTKPKTTKSVARAKVSVSGLKAPLYNLKAESIGDITLPKSVFDSKVSQDTISMALRVYQYNLRSAHAKSKDRGEVAGTTKKMWAQKGTGRARHGSAKAPQFVGGGSAHGPQGNQNFQKKLNKKVKTAVMNGLYTKFATNKLILVIDQLKDLAPKTKAAWNVIDGLENVNTTLANSKKIGIITSAPLTNVKRAFANIPGLNYFTLKSVNLLNLADQNFLIFSKKALEDLAK